MLNAKKSKKIMDESNPGTKETKGFGITLTHKTLRSSVQVLVARLGPSLSLRSDAPGGL